MTDIKTSTVSAANKPIYLRISIEVLIVGRLANGKR
jgi:hypothetical protein